MATDEFFSFKVWHPRGLQITVSLSPERVIDVATAQTLFANVDAVLAAGFTVDAPGKPEGGEVQMIGWVSRREQVNDDPNRPNTPIIDLYLDHEAWQGRMVGIYLNTDDEIAAFEHACGIKLAELPVYPAAAPAKRDDARSSKFIVRLPHPAAAYIGDNPRWEGEGDKKNQKRKFFGWKDAPVTPANVTPITQATGNPTTPPASSAAGVSGGSGASRERVTFDNIIPDGAQDSGEKPASAFDTNVLYQRAMAAKSSAAKQGLEWVKNMEHFNNLLASMSVNGELDGVASVDAALDAIELHYRNKKTSTEQKTA